MTDVRLVPPIEDDLWFVPRAAWADDLRADALAIVRDAIDAAAPGPLVASALERVDIRSERVLVVAAGKAASTMARAAVGVLGESRVRGIVVAPRRSAEEIAGLQTFEAGHPLPDGGSAAAAEAVAQLLSENTTVDDILVLLSGGASALLALPTGAVSIEDHAAVTSLLLERGADIAALNTVRKHIDGLKGGQLARRAAPARVVALVLSDVVGDALGTIASGPVSPDLSTYADAIEALRITGAWAGTPERVRRHLERGQAGEYADTPKPGDPLFAKVRAEIIGNNTLARDGAAGRARALGYEVVMLDEPITGEARDAGAAFARRALALREGTSLPIALIAGGETTVTVSGAGRGGRNQEFALAAAIELAGAPDVLVASFGTDGVDGPTSVAGAVTDGDSMHRAADRGLDARACLDDNDAFGFFGCLHDLLLTGPTGTNVLDVQLALVRRATSPASS